MMPTCRTSSFECDFGAVFFLDVDGIESSIGHVQKNRGFRAPSFLSLPQSGCLLLHHKTPLSAANTIAAMSNFFVPILSALHEYCDAAPQ